MLLALAPAAVRVVTCTSRADTSVTLTPGTGRSRSPTWVADVWVRSGPPSTLTAAGAVRSDSGARLPVTTTVSP